MNQQSIRRLLSNGFVILVAALLIWVFTIRRSKPDNVATHNGALMVAVDLSPNGLQIDQNGELSGKQIQFLDLILPEVDKELVPYTSRTDALAALTKGEVHLYATSIPFSPEVITDNIKATEWLYQSRFSLIYKEKDKEWEKRFSDKNASVVVSSEDLMAVTILENLIELSFPSLSIDIRDQSPLELGIEVSKGNITYLMCDTDIAESIVAADTTLNISHNVGFELRQVWLVNSEQDSLLQSLDSIIIALRGKEQWIKIINSNL